MAASRHETNAHTKGGPVLQRQRIRRRYTLRPGVAFDGIPKGGRKTSEGKRLRVCVIHHMNGRMDRFGSSQDHRQIARRADRLSDAFEACANPAGCVIE